MLIFSFCSCVLLSGARGDGVAPDALLVDLLFRASGFLLLVYMSATVCTQLTFKSCALGSAKQTPMTRGRFEAIHNAKNGHFGCGVDIFKVQTVGHAYLYT